MQKSISIYYYINIHNKNTVRTIIGRTILTPPQMVPLSSYKTLFFHFYKLKFVQLNIQMAKKDIPITFRQLLLLTVERPDFFTLAQHILSKKHQKNSHIPPDAAAHTFSFT